MFADFFTEGNGYGRVGWDRVEVAVEEFCGLKKS